MVKFGVNQPVRRREDVRLLTGEGNYIDDNPPPGALFVQFLYSPIAHGRIISIDTDTARSSAGVHAVYTAADLVAAGMRNRMVAGILELADGRMAANPPRPVLAEDRVRFVGEAVAMVVADTLDQARDAAELIDLDIDEIEPHLSVDAGGVDIHRQAPGNQAFDWWRGDEKAVASVFNSAPHVVSLHVDDTRIIANSIEPRGCHADWIDGRLHYAVNGQGVWAPRDEMSQVLGVERSQIRVITPDVGGGFGMKAFCYPENFAVAQAARMLGRPLRWMSTRSEAMLTDNSGRDLYSKVEAAFDDDYRFLAYRVSTRCNLGAHNSFYAQFIQTELSEKVLTGTYDIPEVFFRVRGFYTNTTPVDAYRGAGRPEAIYMLERLMDRAAREFGIRQSELRRRNFIAPDKFPYRNFGKEVFDVGEFSKVLDRALIEADLAGFPHRRSTSVRNGKLRGIGLCYYIEAILGDPGEATRIEFARDGMVDLHVGTQSNGQGHETVFSQILHQRSGIPFENIRVVQGDSDRISSGGGTGGSRSVTVQGVSINATADRLVENFIPFIAEEFDAAEDQVAFDEGAFRIGGSNSFVTLQAAAEIARIRGRTDLVSFRHHEELPGRSYPNGLHVCEVEFDPDTCRLKISSYTVVDDLGFLVNPMLAEGQVHGGVAQGIGQVILEHARFDESGQLLSGSFMDYAMPRAADLPFIDFHSEPFPSPNNPLGMKGCGEAGTIGAMAAAANAVQDALWDVGVREVNMPLNSDRLWHMLADARNGTG